MLQEIGSRRALHQGWKWAFKYLKINSQSLRSVILITNKIELVLAKKWEKRCDLPAMETLREIVSLCRKKIILSETATYARQSR